MARRFFVSLLVVTGCIGAALVATPAYADNAPVTRITDDSMVPQEFATDPASAIRVTRGLIASGRMSGAIRYLEVYVNAHPADIYPRRFLGDLYFRVGDVTRAKAEYEIILHALPNDKETHNRLGTVYAIENRVDEAIAQFTAALPGTDSVDDLVRLHQRKGDLASYQTQMERAAREFPNDSDLQAELGQIYNAIRQPYSASVYFKRALDTNASNLTARNGYGLSLMDVRDYAGAITQFQACLTVDPTAYQCEENLAAAQLESRDLANAKNSLDRAYHLAPERAETLVNFGYLADIQGDWQKAVTYYARAIETYPYLRESYIDIAIAYEDHKLYTLAQSALLKGLASVPDDGRMHFLLGKAYDAQGKRSDALAQFKMAASGSDPDAARIAKAQFGDLQIATPKPQI